jgi:hypothetical protein
MLANRASAFSPSFIRGRNCSVGKISASRGVSGIREPAEIALSAAAPKFDRLADDFATDEADFHHPEILEHFVKRSALAQ